MLLVSAGDVHGIPRWVSIGISLLFSFNPFIFLFGMNGLSDAPFIFFTMYAVVQLTYWIKEESIASLVKIGFSLALAFWTRYEAVPFGIALGLVLIYDHIHRLRENEVQGNVFPSVWSIYYRIESTLTVVWLPIIYSGLLWMALNYIIMGNPLYFLNSEYSNVEQSAVLATDDKFEQLFGHPLNSLLYVLKRMSFFSIPLAALILVKLYYRQWRRWDLLEIVSVTILFSSIAALQYLLLLQGSSYGWFRYFMYAFPILLHGCPMS